MKPNEVRNKELVRKRIEDPMTWSYEELGKLFRLNKKTAYEIFERDVVKYASLEEIDNYREMVAKKVRGDLSTVAVA